MSDPIVIVSAARTAMGSFQGGFSGLTAANLGAEAIKAAEDLLAQGDAAGAAALLARPLLDRVAISRDRVKIVIAQGGDGKIGDFEIIVDDGR